MDERAKHSIEKMNKQWLVINAMGVIKSFFDWLVHRSPEVINAVVLSSVGLLSVLSRGPTMHPMTEVSIKYLGSGGPIAMGIMLMCLGAAEIVMSITSKNQIRAIVSSASISVWGIAFMYSLNTSMGPYVQTFNGIALFISFLAYLSSSRG